MGKALKKESILSMSANINNKPAKSGASHDPNMVSYWLNPSKYKKEKSNFELAIYSAEALAIPISIF